MNKKHRNILRSSATVLFLGLIVFAALTQQLPFKQKMQMISEEIEGDTDTADIGVPVNEDPWKELQQLLKAYSDSDKDGLGVKGRMKLIDDNGSEEKILEEAEFEYQLVDDEFYYLLDKVEVVSKKGLLLLADHLNKSITVSTPAEIGKRKQKQLFDFRLFRKMMEENHAVARLTQRGNERVLTIDSIKDESIQGYRIYYNPSTYQMSRMLIGMARPFSLNEEDENLTDKQEGESEISTDNPLPGERPLVVNEYHYYLELTYHSIRSLNLDKTSFHPENKFVKMVGNKAELTKAFKTYNLFQAESEEEQSTEFVDE